MISRCARLQVESGFKKPESIYPMNMFISIHSSCQHSPAQRRGNAYVVLSAIWVSIDLNAAF